MAKVALAMLTALNWCRAELGPCAQLQGEVLNRCRACAPLAENVDLQECMEFVKWFQERSVIEDNCNNQPTNGQQLVEECCESEDCKKEAGMCRNPNFVDVEACTPDDTEEECKLKNLNRLKNLKCLADMAVCGGVPASSSCRKETIKQHRGGKGDPCPSAALVRVNGLCTPLVNACGEGPEYTKGPKCNPACDAGKVCSWGKVEKRSTDWVASWTDVEGNHQWYTGKCIPKKSPEEPQSPCTEHAAAPVGEEHAGTGQAGLRS